MKRTTIIDSFFPLTGHNEVSNEQNRCNNAGDQNVVKSFTTINIVINDSVCNRTAN